jgi:hypothetical protein
LRERRGERWLQRLKRTLEKKLLFEIIYTPAMIIGSTVNLQDFEKKIEKLAEID